MKRIILILIVVMASISAFAQQAEADGFGVSAGFDINIPYKDSYDQRFWGTDIRAEYRRTIYKHMFVLPSVGLHYERNNCHQWLGGTIEHGYALGVGLYPLIGVNVPSSISHSMDFFTGPSIRYYYKKDDIISGDHISVLDGERWRVMWSLGMGYNFSRISIRLEYAIKVTQDDWNHNTATLRVAYHF